MLAAVQWAFDQFIHLLLGEALRDEIRIGQFTNGEAFHDVIVQFDHVIEQSLESGTGFINTRQGGFANNALGIADDLYRAETDMRVPRNSALISICCRVDMACR